MGQACKHQCTCSPSQGQDWDYLGFSLSFPMAAPPPPPLPSAACFFFRALSRFSRSRRCRPVSGLPAPPPPVPPASVASGVAPKRDDVRGGGDGGGETPLSPTSLPGVEIVRCGKGTPSKRGQGQQLLLACVCACQHWELGCVCAWAREYTLYSSLISVVLLVVPLVRVLFPTQQQKTLGQIVHMHSYVASGSGDELLCVSCRTASFVKSGAGTTMCMPHTHAKVCFATINIHRQRTTKHLAQQTVLAQRETRNATSRFLRHGPNASLSPCKPI